MKSDRVDGMIMSGQPVYVLCAAWCGRVRWRVDDDDAGGMCEKKGTFGKTQASLQQPRGYIARPMPGASLGKEDSQLEKE
jgi:hypothetical protein